MQAAGLPDAGVDADHWGAVRREINGELPPSISTGDVIYGVNGRASTRSTPTTSGRREDGPRRPARCGSNASTDEGSLGGQADLDTDGNVLERHHDRRRRLPLCGFTNTAKLLVRAAGNGDIGDLPDDVGRWWSTNGDLLTTQFLSTPTGAFQGGPASIGSLDWDNPAGPVTVLFAPVPFGSETHSMETIGMFIPDGHGRWDYDQGRDQVGLTFPASAHGAAMAAARERVAKVGKVAGATSALDITEKDPRPSTRSAAPSSAICDGWGRPGQRAYVNDGARSTACANHRSPLPPLAERNIRQILRRTSAPSSDPDARSRDGSVLARHVPIGTPGPTDGRSRAGSALGVGGRT